MTLAGLLVLLLALAGGLRLAAEAAGEIDLG